jgi:acetoin utilization deacetylase AcuC-like enzyme
VSQTAPIRCYTADVFRLHDPGPHPDRPARYDAVLEAVTVSGAEVADAPPAPFEALLAIHDRQYLEGVRRLCAEGGGALDADTVVNVASYDAAVRASGAAMAAVDAVLAGEIRSAFTCGRPPGHHAERATPMGFCIVNHVAVAAAHARAAGVERVAVLDWDAHHGNGTQAAFWDDPTVLYVSLHQFPLYPGTGAVSERGGGEGAGTTVNIALDPGTGRDAYLEAFRTRALPALRGFDPTLLLVSAGFDAHRADPLTDLDLDTESFATMTRELRGIGAGPVMVLEGGYDLTALRDSTTAVLTALAEYP